MGQVQVDHRGIDLFVPKELLDRVEMCAGLQQMGGNGMAQRMDGRRREVKLLAGDDDEALQGTAGQGVFADRIRSAKAGGVWSPRPTLGNNQRGCR